MALEPTTTTGTGVAAVVVPGATSLTTSHRARSLIDRIGDALETMTTIEIATVVCPLTITADEGRYTVDPEPSGDNEGALTRIDLLRGKIRNFISEEFTTPTRASLMDFHKTQVVLGREIITGNLQALSDLAQSLINGSSARKS